MIAEVQAEWTAMRQLTVDLLDACSNDELHFALAPGQGALWKQFRHIGRVQEDYLLAFETGHVVFDPANGSFTGAATVPDLTAYLARIDARHTEMLQTLDPNRTVDWFGEMVSAQTHLVRLISHETLHHGQLMLAWMALGHKFPPSWAAWGEA